MSDTILRPQNKEDIERIIPSPSLHPSTAPSPTSSKSDLTLIPESVLPRTPSQVLDPLEYEEQAPALLEADIVGSILPRVDGGKGAWMYLAAATCQETIVWGFANSYGVFLEHYNSEFTEDKALLPIVGTIMMGSMYLLLPLFQLYLTPNPQYRTITMWIGLGIVVAGLVGAAFAPNAKILIFTQGIMYGLGGTMLYSPTTAYMFEWWLKRRGFASGVMFSGTGIGGLIMPIISSSLLDHFGRRIALLSIAVGYAISLSIVIPFIRPRLPLPIKGASQKRRIDWRFVTGKAFWLISLGVALQGLAAFMPSTYLPAYASALALPSSIGTLSISMMNLARVPGQILLGYASDIVSARKMIIIMALVSTLTVFAGWGAATNVAGVIGFAIAFGAFAGSYTALFPRFIAVVAHEDPYLPAILYALYSFARGLGSIASGPMSSALLDHPLVAKGGYGVGGYGLLIIFTGVGMVGSGVAAAFKGFSYK